ncbi:MAG: DUF5821 family protein [Methanocella sp.]
MERDRSKVGMALKETLMTVISEQEAIAFLSEVTRVRGKPNIPDVVSAYLVTAAIHGQMYKEVRAIAGKSRLASAETLDRRLKALEAAGIVCQKVEHQGRRGKPSSRLVISKNGFDVLQT